MVQINEAKFGKQEYHKGRHIEGCWVIRMIEDWSDDLRLELCTDDERSGDVLIPRIQKHVAVQTTIRTDKGDVIVGSPS